MFEKKFQSVLWISVLLLSGSACGSQNAAVDSVANARAAALTNQVDDDKDGDVDENDEGLDDDQDGRVDEGEEHHDACRHRADHHEDSDSDAGVDEDSESDEALHKHGSDDEDSQGDEGHSGHHDDNDADKDSDEAERAAKTAADIAAIDCSDVPADSGATEDATPADAGL